jgi:hypothetical protein
MNYILTVDDKNIQIIKDRKIIDEKSINDDNIDLWILKFQSNLNEDDHFMVSSSIHWEFIVPSKKYIYAYSGEGFDSITEIIINEKKLKKENDFLVRELSNGKIYFKKKKID